MLYLRHLMKVLIKQARIIDPNSSFNGQLADILIEQGIITNIDKNISVKADEIIILPNLHVSPGWVDMFAHFNDPGIEYKETLETGVASAAAGGFTDVLVIPNTKPTIHDKAGVEYIKQKTKHLAVTVHPIGAVTKNTEGKELAEMYDMKASGAVAFSDGTSCIQSSGLLLKALQYVKAFNGTIIQLPDDKSINFQGLMNEGIISTQLGLPGKPAIAEEIMITRDIKLAQYTESNIHFTGVSTLNSIETIRKAKADKCGVSCSVTPYHLFFSDEDLKNYNTNLKVNPPLRTKAEKEALKNTVMEGLVDCIASHHLPQDNDSKVVEFEYAKNGMIGLETSFAAIRTALPQLQIEQVVSLLSTNPRKILGFTSATIKEGNKAILTLFNPKEEWIYTTEKSQSKSKNSPFNGVKFIGKVKGIINGEKTVIN